MTARIEAAPTGCWLWLGTTNGQGRGRVIVGGKYTYAYRHLYELVVGPIPAGLVLDHLCRIPLCVNPTHLEPVTQAENMARTGGVCRKGHSIPPRHHQCRICGREWERLRENATQRFADGRGYRDKASGLCVHGHELTEENIYRRKGGSIECRICIRAFNRPVKARYRLRQKAIAA